MEGLRKKKKYVVAIVEVRQPERYKQFEIKLPSNVAKVTGVIITSSKID